MEHKIITTSAEETIFMGEKLAQFLPNGSVITLSGDLGAGKTTLVRGIAKGLHINDVVQSPTFNIMKIYFKGDKPLIHIDAYRLADVDTDIGLDEYIGYETGITLIEWPCYIAKLIPSSAINVEIHYKGETEREFVISGDDLSFLVEAGL